MDAQTTIGYLNREQAAAYLNIAPRTLSEWQARRIVPHIKCGRKCVRFNRADLDAAMQRFTVRAVGMV
jgi:excisionase family DNA binding protein